MASGDRQNQPVFYFDLRSLALYRIVFAALVLADLFVRASDIRAHYTDFGVLPRAVLIEQFLEPWKISLHMISGLAPVQCVLFILAAVFAVMMLIGWHTRTAVILSWIWMVSLHSRNVMVLQSGDLFFRMQLFWSMFLPLGARFSIDSLRRRRAGLPPDEGHYSFLSAAGFTFQVAFVYWFSVLSKMSPHSAPVWWTTGDALHRALHVDQFTRPLGFFMRTLPYPVLQLLSRVVIVFQTVAPFLLFIPWRTAWMKFAAVILFWGFHLGLGTSMVLGPFPLVSSAAMIPFLPYFFWDWLRPLAPRLEALGARLAAFWQANQYLQRMAVDGLRVLGRRSVHWISVSVIFYVLWWNLTTVARFKLPAPPSWIGHAFGFAQRWNMFSPPLTDDGWYVIPGWLKSGRQVDLFRKGAPVTWEKPARVSKLYKHERWRKYMMNIWSAAHNKHRLHYGRYLCRDWNSRHRGIEQLERFEIYYMRESTAAYGMTPAINKVQIWKHWCFQVPPAVAAKTAAGSKPEDPSKNPLNAKF